MLTIECTPILLSMISKIDTKPLIKTLKELDIFEVGEEVSGEKAIILGTEIFTTLTPQLGKIADDIPKFVALYKGVTVEEAGKLSVVEVFKELFSDEDIKGFFSKASGGPAKQ